MKASEYYNELLPETTTTEEYLSKVISRYLTTPEDPQIMKIANHIYKNAKLKSKAKILQLSNAFGMKISKGRLTADSGI